MYSNVYGVDGVKKLIQIMKSEILNDAAQIGITDFHNISTKVVSKRAMQAPHFFYLSSRLTLSLAFN
jgi:L-lactate dehydrogenase (cytochrome)